MKRSKLIVFDIDGTLTNSVKQHQKAFSEMLYNIGVSKIKSEFGTFKHHTDSYISKAIYEIDQKKVFTKEKIIQFEAGLTEIMANQKIIEIPGARKLISKLQSETEYGVCFATGSLRRPAEHKLNSIGIDFEEWQLVASDQLFERESIVQKAIANYTKRYEISKLERIISVGDGLWDLLTAQNLELDFIGIGIENKSILFENGAKVVYKDLNEFKIE